MTALLHLQRYNLQNIPPRPECGAVPAARWWISDPRRGRFFSISTMGFGVRVHFLWSNDGREAGGQKICSILDHVWNHYTLTVTCIQYEPVGAGGRPACMFPRNFPAPHGKDVVGLLPPLMPLIRPHAFSSACAGCEASL